MRVCTGWAVTHSALIQSNWSIVVFHMPLQEDSRRFSRDSILESGNSRDGGNVSDGGILQYDENSRGFQSSTFHWENGKGDSYGVITDSLMTGGDSRGSTDSITRQSSGSGRVLAQPESAAVNQQLQGQMLTNAARDGSVSSTATAASDQQGTLRQASNIQILLFAWRLMGRNGHEGDS